MSDRISGWASARNSGCDSLAEVGRPRSVNQSGMSSVPVSAAGVSLLRAAVGADVDRVSARNSGCDSLAAVGKPRPVNQSGMSSVSVSAPEISLVKAAVGRGVG